MSGKFYQMLFSSLRWIYGFHSFHVRVEDYISLIFLMLLNSMSGIAQFGHDALPFSFITGFSLLMFCLFRTFESVFMSKIDMLFFFLVLSMPGFGIKITLLNKWTSASSFSVIWNNLWLFGSICFLIMWLNLMMKLSGHGTCFVGIFLTANSISFMIVDCVGIVFFFLFLEGFCFYFIN